MNCFILTIIALLSIIGFADIIRAVAFWLLKLPKEGMSLVTYVKNSETAENTVRSVMEKFRWFNIPAKIIFVYPDNDFETRDITKKIISQYPDIGLSSERDLNYNNIKNI